MERRNFLKSALTVSTGAALAGCTVNYKEDDENTKPEIELEDLFENISQYEGEDVKTSGLVDYQGQEETKFMFPQTNPDGTVTMVPMTEETKMYHLYENGDRDNYIAVSDEGNNIDSLLEQDGDELVLTGEIVEYDSDDPQDYLMDVDTVLEP